MKKWEKLSALATVGILVVAIISFIYAKPQKPTSVIKVTGKNNTVNQIINQRNMYINNIPKKDLIKPIRKFEERKKIENIPKESTKCFEDAISNLHQGKANLDMIINNLKCSIDNYKTPEAYDLLGRCFYLQKEYKNALESFENSKKLYEKDKSYLKDKATLGNVYRWINKTKEKIKKNFDYEMTVKDGRKTTVPMTPRSFK